MNKEEEDIIIDSLLSCDDDRIPAASKNSKLSLTSSCICYEVISPWKSTFEVLARRDKHSSKKRLRKKSKLKKSIDNNINNNNQDNTATKTYPIPPPPCFRKSKFGLAKSNIHSPTTSTVNETFPMSIAMKFLQNEDMHSFATKNKETSLKKKLTRSTGVLSYDIPSWRFITDLKTFEYLNRCHPKDVLKYFKFTPRAKSSISWKKQKTYILDPAAFIDERLAVSYKAWKKFVPEKGRHDLMKEINNSYINPQNRLFSKSMLKLAPDNDRYVPEQMNINSVNINCSIRNPKVSGKRKSKNKRLSNKLPNITVKVEEDGLQRESPKLSLPKIIPRNRFTKGPNKVYNSSMIHPKDYTNKILDRTNLNSSTSYLPTLNFNNYQPDLCIPSRIDIKRRNQICHLPPIGTSETVMDLSPAVSKMNLL